MHYIFSKIKRAKGGGQLCFWFFFVVGQIVPEKGEEPREVQLARSYKEEDIMASSSSCPPSSVIVHFLKIKRIAVSLRAARIISCYFIIPRAIRQQKKEKKKHGRRPQCSPSFSVRAKVQVYTTRDRGFSRR